MTDLMARLVAAASAALLAAALIVLYMTSNPGLTGTSVRAEFKDVFPLLPGMHVRVFGAVAGSVRDVELTDHGSALVTMQLNEGTEPPARDATAAIRQQDITGDSYVSLTPGDDDEPLGDAVIPTSRTLVAPRFDDLLNSFDSSTRTGLQLTLVELGKALEARGADLNGAALDLRRALFASNNALSEVQSQNQALRHIVTDAERVTGQAASRSRELDRLVVSLDTTLRTTALHGPALDAALDVAPETSRAAQGVLARLATTARQALPVTRTLASAAPELASAVRKLGPFADDAAIALDDARPTVDLTRRLLHAAEPTLKAAPKRALTAPFDLAAASGALLNSLLGEPALMKALFGADAYGAGPSRLDDVGLGSLAVELGTQAGYPDNDPERRFLRAKTVLSCESLGLPIRPGCLLDFLGSGTPKHTAQSGARPNREGPHPTRAAGIAAPRPDRQLPGRVGDALRDLSDRLRGTHRHRHEGRNPGALHDLLDFLLGP